MKEPIAFLALVVIAGPTIYYAFKKAIDPKLAAVLLCFSLLSSFFITNYDIIIRFK